MSEPFDDFFDDEQDLMREDATSTAEPDDVRRVSASGVPGAKALGALGSHLDPGASRIGTAPEVAAHAASIEDRDEAGRSPRQSPPFWMVLAIACVSLLLGVVIGYLAGTSATIAELSAEAERQAADESEGPSSLSMPEGHPEVDVDEEGNATLAEGGSDGPSTEGDVLARANSLFDTGMAALESAEDDEARQRAAGLFAQAVESYDEYLGTTSSPSAEVDRAICVFYSGDHEGAIADLESFVERDGTFAPAWANLGMFYEAHGDTDKAVGAYRSALDAAEEEDTYGVGDYARRRLDALEK